MSTNDDALCSVQQVAFYFLNSFFTSEKLYKSLSKSLSKKWDRSPANHSPVMLDFKICHQKKFCHVRAMHEATIIAPLNHLNLNFMMCTPPTYNSFWGCLGVFGDFQILQNNHPIGRFSLAPVKSSKNGYGRGAKKTLIVRLGIPTKRGKQDQEIGVKQFEAPDFLYLGMCLFRCLYLKKKII